MSAHVLAPLVRNPGGDFQLANTRNQRVLADRLLPAFDSRSRRTGLLGLGVLPPGSAMVIAPTNAIHTFFMRFPIDIAFVDRDGRILKTCARVRPWRIAIALRAFAAIEMPQGTLASSETIAGDRLRVTPIGV